MGAEVRAGVPMRAVARAHHVSLSTVQWWCQRAGARSLEEVDWRDHPPIAGRIHRTAPAVEDLVGGLRIEVLNVVSLLGGWPGAWPQPLVTAKTAVAALVAHWREFGRPAYAQFDNDTIFQGAHQHRDSISRVMRTCLRLDVTPVFAPPRESGFQAAIENFNGRWQTRVWARFHHDSLAALHERSRRYLRAYRQRAAARGEAAPPRRPFPAFWLPDLQAQPRGVVIFIRRTSETGRVSLLGRTVEADPLWPHRLVRCEVDLSAETTGFMPFAVRARITNRSCARFPTPRPGAPSMSDRQAVAPPF